MKIDFEQIKADNAAANAERDKQFNDAMQKEAAQIIKASAELHNDLKTVAESMRQKESAQFEKDIKQAEESAREEVKRRYEARHSSAANDRSVWNSWLSGLK